MACETHIPLKAIVEAILNEYGDAIVNAVLDKLGDDYSEELVNKILEALAELSGNKTIKLSNLDATNTTLRGNTTLDASATSALAKALADKIGEELEIDIYLLKNEGHAQKVEILNPDFKGEIVLDEEAAGSLVTATFEMIEQQLDLGRFATNDSAHMADTNLDTPHILGNITLDQFAINALGMAIKDKIAELLDIKQYVKGVDGKSTGQEIVSPKIIGIASMDDIAVQSFASFLHSAIGQALELHTYLKQHGGNANALTIQDVAIHGDIALDNVAKESLCNHMAECIDDKITDFLACSEDSFSPIELLVNTDDDKLEMKMKSGKTLSVDGEDLGKILPNKDKHIIRKNSYGINIAIDGVEDNATAYTLSYMPTQELNNGHFFDLNTLAYYTDSIAIGKFSSEFSHSLLFSDTITNDITMFELGVGKQLTFTSTIEDPNREKSSNGFTLALDNVVVSPDIWLTPNGNTSGTTHINTKGAVAFWKKGQSVTATRLGKNTYKLEGKNIIDLEFWNDEHHYGDPSYIYYAPIREIRYLLNKNTSIRIDDTRAEVLNEMWITLLPTSGTTYPEVTIETQDNVYFLNATNNRRIVLDSSHKTLHLIKMGADTSGKVYYLTELGGA